MKIRWTTEATENLEQIRRHNEKDNREAALRTPHNFRPRQEAFRFPKPWPRRTCGGTRELVLSPLPYFVVYRVQDETVEILYIRHGAQLPHD